jgi:predicted metalloprotease
MKWSTGDRSNIDDQRASSGGRAVPIGIGGLLVLAVLSWATGTDFLSMFTSQSGSSGPAATQADRPLQTTPAEERTVDMVDAVTKDVQDTWSQLLGSRYERTRVELFRDAIESGCGVAQTATGPFYCPADSKVYLDLGFFKELSDRFGAPGEFAEAYVIAHEFGHHVQNLMGLQPGALQNSREGQNSASVAIELQADCFAGVWGHAASEAGRFKAGRVELDPGDAEQALRAAAAIGDDRLQKMATGHVMPERFTHGSSAQRVAAFKRGMTSGDPRACGTSPGSAP